MESDGDSDDIWEFNVDRNDLTNYLVRKITSVREDTFNRQFVTYLKNYLDKRGVVADKNQLKEIIYSLLVEVHDRVVQKISKEQGEISAIDKDLTKSRIIIIREKLMGKAKSHVERHPYQKVAELKLLNGIDEVTKKALWTEYANEWTRLHPKSNVKDSFDKPSAIKDSFKDKLVKFVIEHSDDSLMSKEEFERLTGGWDPGRRTVSEWYDVYRDLYFKQPGKTFRIPESKMNRISGFKTKRGMKTIKPTTVKNSFPLKENRKYQLHKVSPPNTYIIDLMFCGKLVYLIAIEVNTRFTYGEITNMTIGDMEEFSAEDTKKATSFLRALQRMIDQGMNARHLIGDGESAFKSRLAKSYYRDHGIVFHPVERQKENYIPKFLGKMKSKTSPYHTSLSLVDRVIRTIRDMAYELQVGTITPKVMKIILDEYNNTYHSTLTKYAGFKVTPMMAHKDRRLEEMIVTKIKSENWCIINNTGFKLKEGTRVKVYNDLDKMGKRRTVIRPGVHEVVRFEDGKYVVMDENGETSKVPRFKIDPL